MTMETPRQRRGRVDAGRPRATARDVLGMSWVVEMYGMPFDLLRRLVGTSDGATRQMIYRWRRAGWVSTEYFGGPMWLWATRAGIERFGRYPYQERPPSQARLEHTRAVIETRLRLEERYADRELSWVSERALRYELGSRLGSAAQRQHVPDAVIEYIAVSTEGVPFQRRAAVEVELTPKSEARAEEIVGRLKQDGYDEVLYVVSRRARPLMQHVIEKKRRQLPPGAMDKVRLIDFEEGQ
ncbi:hypothetical protein [Sphaerobacter sp.]|uniref:hypothetical protein n=1 Tax=Sphaerobacter sp. TaxID=2099654 RepID=UPI001DF2A24E|nr:hypothetical protein [Sphaerobacter sp.]MBX5446664.1 hypothetical protein [Sphaerobacter sp.]